MTVAGVFVVLACFGWRFADAAPSVNDLNDGDDAHLLFRCTSKGKHKFVSTDKLCEGAEVDATLGCIASSPSRNDVEAHSVALTRCFAGPIDDHLCSTSICPPSYKEEEVLGYLYTSMPAAAADPVQLWRCISNTGHHFASIHHDCGFGGKVDASLGWLTQSCGAPSPPPPPAPPTPPPNPNLLPIMNTATISNDEVAVTIDAMHGCSISAMWATTDPAKTNLINTKDLGRYVQTSYYSGPSQYDDCTFRGQPWPWNPISAGDKNGNPSRIIYSGYNKTHATCIIQPMQWACANVACECSVSVSYSLVGGPVMKAEAVLNNHRNDTTVYPKRDQEIPAVYVNGFLDRLVGYTGNAPCTNDSLTEWNAGFNNSLPFPWVPGGVQVTEGWLAFLQTNGFGLAVYSNDTDNGTFVTGFSGEKGSGGTHDGATGYIAPVSVVSIPGQGSYKYEYSLVIGNINDIRTQICHLHKPR